MIHPSIDACVQLKNKGIKPEQIERIDLRVHSLVLELTGKKEPQDGLQGKFSVYHSCAAGLTFGRAGEEEYEDALVNRADMQALRRKINAIVDDSIDEAAADLTAHLSDGTSHHIRVDHAIGSMENPMTDALLMGKFHALSDAVLGETQTQALIDECWSLAKAANLKPLLALCIPKK